MRNDGSNSNDGLTNTSGGAFLTVQKAIDVMATIDLNGFVCNIQIGQSGSYAGWVCKNVMGCAGPNFMNIIGDTATPSNVVITSNITLDALNVPWTIDSMKLDVPGGTLVTIARGSTLFGGRIEIGSCAVGIANSLGTFAWLGFPITISGKQTAVVLYTEGGRNTFGGSYTFKGCPSFGTFCVVNYMSMTFIHGSTFTYTAATFDAATDRVTVPSHGKAANDPVAFSGGTLPTPLTAGTTYFVKTVIDANTFTVSATAGGAQIDLTTNGSGTINAIPPNAGGAGVRYNVLNNSVLFTNGGGAAYLPGQAAGSTDASSVYS